MISAPFSTPKASRCAPGITARCRSWNSSTCRRRRARRSRCYIARRRHRRAGRRARQGARGVRLMDLKELYRDVILDHNKSPRTVRPARARRLVAPTGTIRCAAIGCTSRCASKATASRDMRFEGKGCAISVASASLMCEAVKGKRARRDRAPVQRSARSCSPNTTRRSRRISANSPRCPACASFRCA